MPLAVIQEGPSGKVALALGIINNIFVENSLTSLEIAKQGVKMNAEFSFDVHDSTIEQANSQAEETRLDAQKQQMSVITSAVTEGAAQGAGAYKAGKAQQFDQQEEFGRKTLAEYEKIQPKATTLGQNSGVDLQEHPLATAVVNKDKSAFQRPYQSESMFKKLRTKIGIEEPTATQEAELQKMAEASLTVKVGAAFKEGAKYLIKKSAATATRLYNESAQYVAAAQRWQGMSSGLVGSIYDNEKAAQQEKTGQATAQERQQEQLAANNHTYDLASQLATAELQAARELSSQIEKGVAETNRAA